MSKKNKKTKKIFNHVEDLYKISSEDFKSALDSKKNHVDISNINVFNENLVKLFTSEDKKEIADSVASTLEILALAHVEPALKKGYVTIVTDYERLLFRAVKLVLVAHDEETAKKIDKIDEKIKKLQDSLKKAEKLDEKHLSELMQLTIEVAEKKDTDLLKKMQEKLAEKKPSEKIKDNIAKLEEQKKKLASSDGLASINPFLAGGDDFNELFYLFADFYLKEKKMNGIAALLNVMKSTRFLFDEAQKPARVAILSELGSKKIEEKIKKLDQKALKRGGFSYYENLVKDIISHKAEYHEKYLAQLAEYQ